MFLLQPHHCHASYTSPLALADPTSGPAVARRSTTLPCPAVPSDSLTVPHQNGVAERRIGLVMEIARTSIVRARAPQLLWPYAVRYVASGRVPVSPTRFWTRSPSVASEFRVWGILAFVRDTSTARTLPWDFLGFPAAAPDLIFYHPPLHQFFDSRNITFDESVSYYARYPHRGFRVLPPPFFIAPTPPPASAHPQPLALPRPVVVDSGGVGTGGAGVGGVGSGGARVRGTGTGGAGFGGAGARGTHTRGAGSTTPTTPAIRYLTRRQQPWQLEREEQERWSRSG
ncbi:unnamed protein product [Closterium sp. NIES-54]